MALNLWLYICPPGFEFPRRFWQGISQDFFNLIKRNSMNKMILYTKPVCHLCDEMKYVIANLKKESEFDFEEINIELNETLFDKYKEKIPVLMLNGRMIAKYHISEEKLLQILTS